MESIESWFQVRAELLLSILYLLVDLKVENSTEHQLIHLVCHWTAKNFCDQSVKFIDRRNFPTRPDGTRGGLVALIDKAFAGNYSP